MRLDDNCRPHDPATRRESLLLWPFGEKLLGFILQRSSSGVTEELLLVGLDQCGCQLGAGRPIGNRKRADVDKRFSNARRQFGDQVVAVRSAHDVIVGYALQQGGSGDHSEQKCV